MNVREIHPSPINTSIKKAKKKLPSSFFIQLKRKKVHNNWSSGIEKEASATKKEERISSILGSFDD